MSRTAPNELCRRVLEALQHAHLSTPGVEEPNAFDDVLSLAKTDVYDVHQWRSALTYLAAEELPKNEALWPEFELFCALIDRVNLSDELIAVLQETVAKNTCRLSASRLSIYNLLMYMHRSHRAKKIAKVIDLSKSFPINWLELFVANNADLS